MYKIGKYSIYKPCAKSRHRFNIEIGEATFGVGVLESKIKTTSYLPSYDDIIQDENDMDEVCIMNDGKVLYMMAHKDN